MTNANKRLRNGVGEKEIDNVFRKADLDKDGYLSPREAMRAYKKVCKMMNKASDKVTP